MNKIKLLVVDDSIFMRKVIIDILSDVPYIEIVGEASDGEEAIEKAIELRPAVITMDYKMPKKNGLEATDAIMKTKNYSPGIIIFSAYTQDGIKEAFRGLRSGAIDFIAKPSGEFSPNLDATKTELLSKIKIAADAYQHTLNKNEEPGTKIVHPLSIKPDAVIIGASTGGPPVLEKILTGLKSDLNCPIFVVQHMPERFTSVFAELINNKADMDVFQAVDGQDVLAGKCYIAKSGFHMKIEAYEEQSLEISKKIIHFTKEPKVSGYRPSIDVLMKSAATNYPGRCLGIILTGMGKDGLDGCQAIHKNGGHIIAQSLKSAVIESMPLSIIDAGIADEVLEPHQIVDIINSSCR